jgi:hypothetical protein
MVWLIAIAANPMTTGIFYDLAVRDLEIAVGTFALSQLTAVREECSSKAREEESGISPRFARTSSSTLS